MPARLAGGVGWLAGWLGQLRTKNELGMIFSSESIEVGRIFNFGVEWLAGWLAGLAGWLGKVFQEQITGIRKDFQFGGGGVAGSLAGPAG